jgi:hypothetical protein
LWYITPLNRCCCFNADSHFVAKADVQLHNDKCTYDTGRINPAVCTCRSAKYRCCEVHNIFELTLSSRTSFAFAMPGSKSLPLFAQKVQGVIMRLSVNPDGERFDAYHYKTVIEAFLLRNRQ